MSNGESKKNYYLVAVSSVDIDDKTTLQIFHAPENDIVPVYETVAEMVREMAEDCGGYTFIEAKIFCLDLPSGLKIDNLIELREMSCNVGKELIYSRYN